MPDPVDRALTGFADAPVSPSLDPARLGRVRLEPAGPFPVRSLATLRLVYTVGHHGLDDRGSFKIVMRFPADGGAWQLENPSAPNHVHVQASRPCGFRARFDAFGNSRPWFKALTVQVVEGCLREGDTVTVTLSIRLQTFCEDAWELRFLVDPCATQHFVEVVDRLSIPIVPGPPDRWVLVGPTRWPVGEPMRVLIKAEDAHGNPSDQVHEEVVLHAEPPIPGLPRTVPFAPGVRAVILDDVTCPHEGPFRFSLTSAAGHALATHVAVHAVSDGMRHVWGDLHGQSGETVGINSAASYYRFGRDLAGLDVCSHQGNDFQINTPFWGHLNALSAELEAPGRFVTFPGYEWSGNTAVGGDRNVYFRHEGGPIRRSSHALLLDRSDIETDATTAGALFEALRGEDCVVYAHVGGRWADLTVAHDEALERAVEIHSAWGTFEWLLHDAFRLGLRVGVVANSDGHKGRPGASYPGAATFGAYGGLTCFQVPVLTRDAVFAAIRERRTYGTSGARIGLEVAVRLPNGTGLPMGSVASTDAREVTVEVQAWAGAPIAWVEIRRGEQVMFRHRPYGPAELGDRIGVRWEGARYRGRGRQVHWDGTAQLSGACFGTVTRINAWNPDHVFEASGAALRWEAVTTGNFGGFDVPIHADSVEARLLVRTAHAVLDVAVAELGIEPVRIDAGGLGMALSAHRLPDVNPHQHTTVQAAIPLHDEGDTPLWVCVTTEDGHQAWSSPVYLHREPGPAEAR